MSPRNPSTTRPGPLVRRLAALLAILVVVTGACSVDEDAAPGTSVAPGPTVAAPPPPSVIPAEDRSTPTIPVPAGFVVPDTRNVRLDPVVGRPQPELDPAANLLPMEGGRATVRATVVDPEGRPVEDALVRFERFAGPFKGWRDIASGDDGVAELRDAPGGRYRLRAWRRPELATLEPQLVFVAWDERIDLRVQVQPHDLTLLQGALTVPSWTVGEVVTFEALLVRQEVAPDGIVVGVPVPGVAVTLNPIAGARVEGTSVGTTDGDGRAFWPVQCVVPGVHQSMLAGVGPAGESLWSAVELPDCLPGEPPPVVDAPPPGPDQPDTTTTSTTSRPGATTTTTSPGGSTTSSTVPAVPVGSTFTVPTAGPVPAGTYTATGPGAASCASSFEVLRGGRWVRQQATGASLVLDAPARAFAAVAGTDPCTYRRIR